MKKSLSNFFGFNNHNLFSWSAKRHETLTSPSPVLERFPYFKKQRKDNGFAAAIALNEIDAIEKKS